MRRRPFAHGLTRFSSFLHDFLNVVSSLGTTAHILTSHSPGIVPSLQDPRRRRFRIVIGKGTGGIKRLARSRGCCIQHALPATPLKLPPLPCSSYRSKKRPSRAAGFSIFVISRICPAIPRPLFDHTFEPVPYEPAVTTAILDRRVYSSSRSVSA
ncbi:hypothetical protein GALMADRAFT_592849 [Galerina marginata CBS 339.88]|uniref:Uncharacterized protein n=1 Tax=Galerina marginata (strain CBS 339.88) TaxID=685588 RepID=A0A067T4B0_GALM3|nr:hypothetical protein GALMADRAFT_592849 [Galerina marginata CBS 339.88]